MRDVDERQEHGIRAEGEEEETEHFGAYPT